MNYYSIYATNCFSNNNVHSILIQSIQRKKNQFKNLKSEQVHQITICSQCVFRSSTHLQTWAQSGCGHHQDKGHMLAQGINGARDSYLNETHLRTHLK